MQDKYLIPYSYLLKALVNAYNSLLLAKTAMDRSWANLLEDEKPHGERVQVKSKPTTRQLWEAILKPAHPQLLLAFILLMTPKRPGEPKPILQRIRSK